MVNIPFCAGVYFRALGSLFECPMQKECGRVICLYGALPQAHLGACGSGTILENSHGHPLVSCQSDRLMMPNFCQERSAQGTNHTRAHLRGAPCASQTCLVTGWCCHPRARDIPRHGTITEPNGSFSKCLYTRKFR